MNDTAGRSGSRSRVASPGRIGKGSIMISNVLVAMVALLVAAKLGGALAERLG